MLSSIGRAAVRRVVARGPRSTNRLLQSTYKVRRVDTVQDANNGSSQIFPFPHRSYATASGAVANPRATKSATAKSTTKTATPRKSTRKTAKKPAKKAVKKATPRKVTKKPVKKKVLTEKQKAKLEKRKNLDEVKALKATALTIPKGKPSTAWTVMFSEYAKANGGTFTSHAAPAVAKYKSLTPAELESYNHTAAQNKAENQAAYKKWVESHTPDQIRLANNARRALRSMPTKSAGGPWTTIVDSRLPKQPVNSLAFFMRDRHASGDLKGIAFNEAIKLIVQEFKSLSTAERQIYLEREAADKDRYLKEHKAVFGRDPLSVLRNKAVSS